MYKVLLVDDEPIVLSGMKFLIDWGKLDCCITNTARNGQQALEIIEKEWPDIVVCDINMPVMSGIEVLKAVYEKSFAPSFIMLTNHQEFDLARKSLRYKALDYLLKTQLEPETLEKAILLAIEDCDKRNKIANIRMMDTAMEQNKSRVISSNLQKLYEQSAIEQSSYSLQVLKKSNIFTKFFMVQIMLDYSFLPMPERFSEQDIQRIFECEHEFIQTLFQKTVKDFAVFYPDNKYQSLIIFSWNLSRENYLRDISQFFTKLVSASCNITQTRLSILITDAFEREEDLVTAFEQLRLMQDYYYATQKNYIHFCEITLPGYEPLDICSLSNKLTFELRFKNIAQCDFYIRKVTEKLERTVHTRKEGIRACSELFTMVSTVLAPMLDQEETNDYFTDISNTIRKINRFTTFSQVKEWLEEFRLQVIGQLEQMTSSKSELLEKVKRYIIENVDQRIMLQDVSNHVNISPSYLSALFKKQYNQNLVDYINKIKMDRACELIREGKHRIYEISYMLSFENAYYFTRVFKRHMGMTPKEYQYKVKGRIETAHE